MLAVAEFSVDAGTGRPWYDISIIPPGPGNCESLAACKAVTGKVGYNTAMSITPLNNAGVDTCNSLVCLADGCADAYLYPADDTKTHTCPAGTDFALTFCPGGTGGATPAPTPSPTPAPVTQAPTPSPTPSVSPTAVKTSSASRDINGELVSSEYDTGSTGFSLASSSSSSVQDKSTDSDATTTVEPSAGTSTSSSSAATTTDSSTPTTSTTATGSNGSGGVVEVSTQSSASSGSTVGILLAMVVVVVGAAAGGVIYAVRKKKQRLDMEAKSPLPTTTHDATSRELAIFMATP